VSIAYGIGDVIEYQLVGGGIRWVRVTNREADIKNGRPGFDGFRVLETSEHGIDEDRLRDVLGLDPGSEIPVWGYDERVLRVVHEP
jgi:hypothetical protein